MSRTFVPVRSLVLVSALLLTAGWGMVGRQIPWEAGGASTQPQGPGVAGPAGGSPATHGVEPPGPNRIDTTAQAAPLNPFDPAPAMTLPTTAGALKIGGQAGNESYVLLGYSADSPVAQAIWQSQPSALIASSPRDVHYVFMSYGATPELVQSDIAGMRQRVEAAIAALPDAAERAHWSAHFHYVTENPLTLDDPAADLLADWGSILARVNAQWRDGAGQAQAIDTLGTTDTGWATSLADSGPVTAQLTDYGNLACNSDGGPTNAITETIALVERGVCPFAEKGANIARHGGVGMLMFTDTRPKGRLLGACADCDIAAVMIDRDPGLKLREALAAGYAVSTTLSVASVLGADGLAVDHKGRVREFGTIPFPFPQFTDPPLDNLMLVAKEAQYFNYEHRLDSRLAEESAADKVTVLPVYQGVWADDPGWTGRRAYADVDFPDAATMATFDTLEVDFGYNCPDNRKAQCPAWDYLVYLYKCDKDNPDVCNTEFGRWITPYWSGGRWVTDLSPMLALVNEGGRQRFGFWTVQRYKLDMTFRLSNRGKGLVPKRAVPLLFGAPFWKDYNKHYHPMEFEVPDWAEKVEVVALITGHGGNDDEGCGEFCNHTHHFSINGGAEHVREHPTASTLMGCADRVHEGVVPNQAGTWIFGRAGWCPGLDVPFWTFDITPELRKGQINELTYKGLFKGQEYRSTANGDPNTPPQGGYDARIEMTSWLVYYAKPGVQAGPVDPPRARIPGKVFVPVVHNGQGE